MACIIKKKNSPFYYVKYRADGKPVELSTKSRNLEVAKRIRNEIEDKMALGVFNLVPRFGSVSIGDYHKEFFETKKLAASSVNKYVRNLQPFIAHFHNLKRMNEFTPKLINDYLNIRKKLVGDWEIHSEFTVIKMFFKMCETLYNIKSPCVGITIIELR